MMKLLQRMHCISLVAVIMLKVMGNRSKEDGKREKIIRSLLKQPANSNCINCNSRGPQYVCTTFWTFVCATCSGIHREFTHRVKSVSMAKFSPEEINYLQAGGNERAKEIYFKEVDLHRVPDNSNVDRLRDFIKHVYVDRRFTGEKIPARPSVTKMGNREEPCDSNRSPGFDQGNKQNNDIGRVPAGAGVITNWRREDRFANGKRSEGDPKVGAKSHDNKKDLNGSIPPAVRPITDILGENSIRLQVIDPSRTSSAKMNNGSANITQQTASSDNLAIVESGPQIETKEISLIDFDGDFQPAVTAAVSQPQQSSDLNILDDSDNWAIVESGPQIETSQPPPYSNPLDSVLTQFSVQPPASGFPNNGTSPIGANVSSSQGFVTNPSQVSQAGITPSHAFSELAAQPSGRKELPADLFAAMYAPQPVHAPFLHAGLPPGVSFSVQYNTAVPMPTFPQSTKATNPFDLGGESSPAQVPEFLAMTSLQNAQPSIANVTDMMHNASIGMATPSWTYPSGAPQLVPAFGDSAMLPDPYKTQQLSSSLPPRTQGINGFGNDITGLNSMNPAIHLTGTAPNPSGNPFG